MKAEEGAGLVPWEPCGGQSREDWVVWMIGRMQTPGLDGAKDQVRRAHPMAWERYDRQSHADPQAEERRCQHDHRRPACTRAADNNGHPISPARVAAREEMS